MSEIMLGVLRMPDELFWSDEPLTRHQHNAIRLEAADEIDRLRAELEQLKAERNWIPVSERLPEPDVQVLIDQGKDISDRYDVDYVDVCPQYGHEFFANYDGEVVRWKYIEPPKDK